MTGHWIAFWIIFGLIPLNGVAVLIEKKLQKLFGLDKLKTQEKISKIIGYILAGWIFDFFLYDDFQ